MSEDTQFIFNEEVDSSQQNTMTPPPLPAQEETPNPEDKKKAVWKQVAIGGAAGVGLGAAAIALTSFTNPDGSHTSELDSMIDDDMDVAMGVNDDMSFSQAFATARAEVGPGGCFQWHGTIYGTYTAEEWNNMSPAERAEFEGHFSWGAGSDTAHHTAHHSSSHTTHTADTAQHAQHTAETHTPQGSNQDYVSADRTQHETHTPSAQGHATNVNQGSGLHVVSLGYDADLNANIGVVEENGHRMMFIDADRDNVFEYAVADVNNNQQIEDDEIIDISDRHLTVETLQNLADNNTTDFKDGSSPVGSEYVAEEAVHHEEVKGGHFVEAEVETPAHGDMVVEASVDDVAPDVAVADVVDAEVSYTEAGVEDYAIDPSAHDASMDMTANDAVSYDDGIVADTDI